jgi:hypothetical protein
LRGAAWPAFAPLIGEQPIVFAKPLDGKPVIPERPGRQRMAAGTAELRRRGISKSKTERSPSRRGCLDAATVLSQ